MRHDLSVEVTEKPPIEILSRSSVLLTVKPQILFFALRWFIGVAHRKTNDTFYGKFWLGGFLVSLTAKLAKLFGRKFWIGFFLGTFQATVLRFQALQSFFFYFNVICCNN